MPKKWFNPNAFISIIKDFSSPKAAADVIYALSQDPQRLTTSMLQAPYLKVEEFPRCFLLTTTSSPMKKKLFCIKWGPK
ncbi:MAG: hypothetical protein H6925_05200 [Holosporaceae bacterium]|nr:MAG: hypothetical protein H6925_05200 [Holosporaceae bacterium]